MIDFATSDFISSLVTVIKVLQIVKLITLRTHSSVFSTIINVALVNGFDWNTSFAVLPQVSVAALQTLISKEVDLTIRNDFYGVEDTDSIFEEVSGIADFAFVIGL